ncbi:hypothetical protein [Lactiplantibacillus modestisalitolerans]|uniref:Uncharacterized protein n=1 Tax=Lactiplantibacillus modestisalitolerans TaxID=1457219 RepID=A0ABV5WWQ6_9LACO|nr:hypothetical protein [Lactiplantibacillus modestisalitolerans]
MAELVPDKVYKCFETSGRYISNADYKTYTRLGNAMRRRDQLNRENSNANYRVLAAKGWFEVDD